jgi:AbrB family looped-hinge helix DNA binding protein
MYKISFSFWGDGSLSYGFVRKVDSVGRILLPKELRRSYGIFPGDFVEVTTKDNGIFLIKRKKDL